jgi:DNA ligase (NAD+)
MNKLELFLNNASRHYYAGNPIITDAQFDALADSCGFSQVGARQHENTERHLYPMYSLQKHYEDDNKPSPLHGERNVTMTPKLDGAAVSLLYVGGVFTRALTRGDGKEGRDVTAKLARLVPESIHHHGLNPTGVYQITGEVCAPLHVENSRNYAAGALNLGDLDEFATRSVEFFAYGVFPYPTAHFTSDIKILSGCGFNTVHDKNLTEIYPTDGLVFRIDSNDRFDELGHTSKHPRGAYARKERGDCVETTITAVEWQVGKSGKVTPVAILEAVMVGDAKVSRATLNNPGFIEALDLRIGDRVAVRRAGEIIPEIVYKIG